MEKEISIRGTLHIIVLWNSSRSRTNCVQIMRGKKRVIEKVMKQIESCGGNFLQKDKTFGWYIENESIVYQKVSQGLQNLKLRETRKQLS